MFKKILLLWMILFMMSLYGENNRIVQQNFITINKKMIEGKVFYSRYEENSFYIMSKFKKIDPVELYGKVVYIMMDSPKSISGSAEFVSYRLKDGKIMIYGNDGSVSRMSLISVKPDRWILMEEDDVIGDGKRFELKKGVEIWFFKKPKGYPPLEKCKPFEMECFVDAFKFPA